MGGTKAAAVSDDASTESDGGSTSKTVTDVENNSNGDNSEDTRDGDDDSAPPNDSSAFQEGEKVLAYFSKFIYEAKVRKVEYRMKEWRYYVHYLGWNKNWDEWAGTDRLMKYTEENLKKQKVLNDKIGNDKNTRPGRASQNKAKSSNVARGKKRKTEAANKEKKPLPPEKLVNIQIPMTLKKQLLDDCEFVTHLGKLVKLPRNPNVDGIFKKYLSYRQKKDGLITDSVGEIMNGLRCYFDNALPVMLLYRSERKQYEKAISDRVSPSAVYGAEHLLRLFVKLPDLLFYANIDEDTQNELQKNLTDFIKFLQKNQSAFFLSTYHSPEDIEGISD